jgi:hypothetical protein
MFKPNPKAMVSIIFNKLFGKEHKHEVRGARVPSGFYIAELNVGDVTLARAQSRDWRKAYKLLQIEVEKLYADGAMLP